MTYSVASRCIFCHQNPLVIARWDKDLPLEFPTQIPSCNSAKSSATPFGWRHNRYRPPNDHRYNFLSTDNKKRADILRTFSASFTSVGKDPSIKKEHRGPSNLAQTMRSRLRFGDALCLVAPTTLQKSFIEHIHPTTRPKWPMSRRDYSDFLVLWPHLPVGNMLTVSRITSSTVTYGSPSLQNFLLLGLPLVLNPRIFLTPRHLTSGLP